MTMNTEKHHVTESATKFLSLFRLLSKVLGFSYGGQLRTRHIFIFQFCCFVIDGVDWPSQSRRGAKDSTDEESAHANNNTSEPETSKAFFQTALCCKKNTPVLIITKSSLFFKVICAWEKGRSHQITGTGLPFSELGSFLLKWKINFS